MWLFYVLFVVMLVAEGLIVGALLNVASWTGDSDAGPYLAWAVFVIGGIVFGEVELRAIRPQQRLRDPLLRACCWCQSHWGILGYLVNSLIIGASPGAAVALRKLDHPRRRSLTWLAAGLFATLWVPIYVLIWP